MSVSLFCWEHCPHGEFSPERLVKKSRVTFYKKVSVLFGYFGISGDFFEEVVGILLVVHAAADVLHAVADDEVVGMEQEIVGGNLVEHFLGEGDCGRLILYEHLRMELFII